MVHGIWANQARGGLGILLGISSSQISLVSECMAQTRNEKRSHPSGKVHQGSLTGTATNSIGGGWTWNEKTAPNEHLASEGDLSNLTMF